MNKIRKGDQVIVLAGRDKGKRGTVSLRKDDSHLIVDGINHKGLFALVELQNGLDMPPTYVAGTRNFYVITRYNWSSYSARSVIELGREVRAAMEN